MKKILLFFSEKNGQKGFTLLLAALVASIVLALGSAIFGIVIKQVTLSSIGKNSQIAFYAADTAAECALYWDMRTDIHANTFATSTRSNPAASIACAGESGITLYPQKALSAATTTFIYAPNGYCAFVTVAKSLNPATNGINTVIHADGYSTKLDPGHSAAQQYTDCNTVNNGAARDQTSINTLPDVLINDRNVLQRSVELHY